MFIKSLNIKNFRNFDSISLDLSPSINIIYGLNATGKTNLVESINFLATLKSFKTSKNRELVKFGNNSFNAQAVYNFLDRDYTFNLDYQIPNRYKIDINGVKYKSKGEILGKFKTIVFCPDDLYLIKDSAEIRRKFLNDTILQFRPKYFKLLSDYNKILKQKNFLLKQDNIDPFGLICDYNSFLAKLSSELAFIRSNFINLLENEAKIVYNEISGNKENLSLKYITKLSNPSLCIKQNEKEFLELFDMYKSREIKASNSLIGIHKDDIEFFIDDNNARSFASQGQTRSIVLSLKFAIRELFLKDSKTLPILILDDVLSELDEKRQDYVLNKIQTGQIIITSPYKDSINIDANLIDLSSIKNKK